MNIYIHQQVNNSWQPELASYSHTISLLTFYRIAGEEPCLSIPFPIILLNNFSRTKSGDLVVAISVSSHLYLLVSHSLYFFNSPARLQHSHLLSVLLRAVCAPGRVDLPHTSVADPQKTSPQLSRYRLPRARTKDKMSRRDDIMISTQPFKLHDNGRGALWSTDSESPTLAACRYLPLIGVLNPKTDRCVSCLQAFIWPN